MKLVGPLHLLAALDAARAADAERTSRAAPIDDDLPPIASTPEAAAAWRRWRDAGTADAGGARRAGLTLPTPRPTI
jgi:hypothetical protein